MAVPVVVTVARVATGRPDALVVTVLVIVIVIVIVMTMIMIVIVAMIVVVVVVRRFVLCSFVFLLLDVCHVATVLPLRVEARHERFCARAKELLNVHLR